MLSCSKNCVQGNFDVDIFLSFLELLYIFYKYFTSCFKKYVGQIFAIFHSSDLFKDFVKHINTKHPNIQFALDRIILNISGC